MDQCRSFIEDALEDKSEDTQVTHVGDFEQCSINQENSSVLRRPHCEGGKKGVFMNEEAISSMETNDIHLTAQAINEQFTILVTNQELQPIDVFLFIQPAEFDSGTGAYTNSLANAQVQPGSSQVKFTYIDSYFAAAQKLTDEIGKVQLSSVSLQEIALKSADSKAQQSDLTFDNTEKQFPILSKAHTVSGGIDNAFQISVPMFPPGQGKYIAGLGAIAQGEYQVATYTKLTGGTTLFVQPKLIFYIALGDREVGRDANFITMSANAAKCDTISGQRTFNVVRTLTGGWTVDGVAQN